MNGKILKWLFFVFVAVVILALSTVLVTRQQTEKMKIISVPPAAAAAPSTEPFAANPLDELGWPPLPPSDAETWIEVNELSSGSVMLSLSFYGKPIAENHTELKCWLGTETREEPTEPPQIRFEGWKEHAHPYVPVHEFRARDEQGQEKVYREPEFITVAALVLSFLTRQARSEDNQSVGLGQFRFNLRQNWARGGDAEIRPNLNLIQGRPF